MGYGITQNAALKRTRRIDALALPYCRSVACEESPGTLRSCRVYLAEVRNVCAVCSMFDKTFLTAGFPFESSRRVQLLFPEGLKGGGAEAGKRWPVRESKKPWRQPRLFKF